MSSNMVGAAEAVRRTGKPGLAAGGPVDLSSYVAGAVVAELPHLEVVSQGTF